MKKYPKTIMFILAAPVWDLPRRLIWGGSGLLMRGDCAEGLSRCQRRLQLR